ncbi:MAG: hypothetical protein OK457_09850, partial [Thaumarchaeota archaeon]|nr:hypothetical protein [Nitrososphaerota archaeon]
KDESSTFINRYFQPPREVNGSEIDAIFTQTSETRFFSVSSEREWRLAGKSGFPKFLFSPFTTLASDINNPFAYKIEVVSA